MEIGQRREGSFLVLRPVGRIDALTSPEFQERLLAVVVTADTDCVVDFSAVELISSAGLRALMTAQRRKAKGRRLAVACLTGVAREIFRISGFAHIVPIFATVEDAVASEEKQAEPAPARPGPEPARPSLAVRFWGTRGSLPAPLKEYEVRAKLRYALLAARGRMLDTIEAIDRFIDEALPFSVRGTFGGNTSCVEIVGAGEEYVLCDLGTGVREFGNRVLAERGSARTHSYNVFLSNLHWDHIMGFPFFAPAYLAGNVIRIHGCDERLRETFERQQSDPSFPVDLSRMRARIEFVPLAPDRAVEVAGFSVTPLLQSNTCGYRFSRDGKAIVYSTDCGNNFPTLDDSTPFIEFYRDADLLIFDAMYSLAETVPVKEDWGHSSNIAAVELAQAAGVKRLVLFRHEPACDDGMIEGVLRDTVRFEEISRRDCKVEVLSAYEGLELTV